MVMGRTVRSTIVGALLIVAALGLTITAADAQEPIQPNQHFIGLVNGSNVAPVVYTVCAGPTWPGRTGPVPGGQTMSVAYVAGGAGSTGPLSPVYAWVPQDAAGLRPNLGKFSEFRGHPARPSAF